MPVRREGENLVGRLCKVLIYYLRLVRYVAGAKARIIHVLWNNKFQIFDRTALMVYYRLLGKEVVLTAHNVNAGRRDSADSWLNRFTLRVQYRLASHIFVHTEKMKQELVGEYKVRDNSITVIPFGINNTVRITNLAPTEAKRILGIRSEEKTILFFGNIGPYKGLDILVTAFQSMAAKGDGYRLIIAGKARGGCDDYLKRIQAAINQDPHAAQVIQRIGYVRDEDVEMYFKAADVLALPYREVSQSGVLFLGYSFGLPVVAADVGCLRDDIVEGRTGYVCRSDDSVEFANALEKYFQSELFENLQQYREQIRAEAIKRHSWDFTGERTCLVYRQLSEEGQ